MPAAVGDEFAAAAVDVDVDVVGFAAPAAEDDDDDEDADAGEDFASSAPSAAAAAAASAARMPTLVSGRAAGDMDRGELEGLTAPALLLPPPATGDPGLATPADSRRKF